MSGGAIGVFDSGVGGLTVLRRIRELLPTESTIYLGDTARLPYGTKSPATVVRYAQGCARLLAKFDLKVLVVACNTASSCAIDALRGEFDMPVLGVIEPGAQRAAEVTRTGRIGVIGTRGTIASGAYQRAIAAVAPGAAVFCQPCPLFVPLAEEGWTGGSVPRAITETYLAGLTAHGIDTLVLGCTHYPLLRAVIASVVGPDVQLVDSAESTAEAVGAILSGLDCANDGSEVPAHRYMATDSPESFASVGAQFLGHPLEWVEWVDSG